MARPAWEAVIASELAVHRRLDALAPPEAGPLDDVTVLIKTFERPRVLRRLVESVRRLYPGLGIVIADDSRVPRRVEGATTIALPYDSGISAGRNAGLAAIETPFFVLCDDDLVFFRGTRLAPLLRRMRAHPEIDLVGGRALDLPHYRDVDTRGRRALTAASKARRGSPARRAEELDGAPPTPLRRGHAEDAQAEAPGGTLAGLERREVVRNFFVGRTERVRQVGWDPQLKLVEHADFFARARGVLTVAYDPELAVLHARTPFDAPYMRHREDVARYQALLALKWR